MIISDTLVEKLLELTPEQLADLKQRQKRSNKSLQALVLEDNLISETNLFEKYAEFANIPFVRLDPKQITPEMLKRIPELVARQYNAIVFGIDQAGDVDIATDDPDDVQAINFLQKDLGNKARFHLAPTSDILNCLDLYRGDVSQELSEVINVQQEASDDISQVREEDVSEDSPIAQTVNLLLEYAIKSDASDIHIEPREDFVQVRYRIDGALHETQRLPKNVLGALVSRIKILSNLKIDERRVPQDGRFKIDMKNNHYALRVSTLPTTEGEKVVMRILSESVEALTLGQLGIWGQALEVINRAIREPNGMLLVTGPTGSGKSTTLFSMLSILNTAKVNISTVEDPVEYKIEGVNQTQVNPQAGLTFASGLRSLLRQDPNIMMVGEIRDSETADLAVQAALTGHLVLSTLHTNDAATSLPRLLDMHIEPFLIASTTNAVVGQRLVRRLCNHCRERTEIDPTTKQKVVSIIELSHDADLSYLHTLEQQAKDGRISPDQPLSTSDNDITHIWKAHEGGCSECNHTGYRGRVGIYEVLDISPSIQDLIVKSATALDIKNAAVDHGMVTMKTDGIIKALRGVTSFEEVFSATKD